MTTLATYLASDGAKTLTALSAELGVSKSRLSQLRDATEWPPELAMKAEAATGGMLNAASLSQVVRQARGLAA
jgi:DNA-binding transcriptional regulator YdaS (Cro superfamily)